MQAGDRAGLAALLRGRRWAALATVGEDGAPAASMVAYAVEPDFSGLVLHLSRLAPHTSNLLARPRASLVVGEPDAGGGDPQVLARVGLEGEASVVPAPSAAYPALKALYLERLPRAAPRFGFADFLLLRLAVERARYVGGFGRAWTLDVDDLRDCAAAQG